MTGFVPIALVVLALLAAAAVPRSTVVPSPMRWTRPFPPMPGHPRITSPYGWRTDPITGKRGFHRGLDLAAPTGTAVFAPYDGVVYRVDRDGVGRGVFSGNAVVVETGGWRWTFMHLSSAVVRRGRSRDPRQGARVHRRDRTRDGAAPAHPDRRSERQQRRPGDDLRVGDVRNEAEGGVKPSWLPIAAGVGAVALIAARDRGIEARRGRRARTTNTGGTLMDIADRAIAWARGS